jgi:hypothetical protein
LATVSARIVLGASMATVCILFFVSASPMCRLSNIFAFSTGNSTATDDNLLLASNGNGGAADGNDEAPPADVVVVADATSAPAPAPVEVRILQLPRCSLISLRIPPAPLLSFDSLNPDDDHRQITCVRASD